MPKTALQFGDALLRCRPMKKLLRDIERFLLIKDMNASDFGILCLNDPGFVTGVRNGRECREMTRDRVKAFIKRRSPRPRRKAA